MNQDVVNQRPVTLGLDQIIIDHEVQVRVDGTNEYTVESYAAVLRNGGELKPVMVFRDEYGDLLLADGFHRYEAHVQVARTEIEAIVIDGPREAALDAAEEENLKHGLQLGYNDKKNLLFRRLARKHEWSRFSNAELGRQLGVTDKTIARWVDEFNSTPTNVEVDRTVTVGADGKIRNTSNIGTNRPEPKPKPTEIDNVDGRGEVRSMPGAGFTGYHFPEKPQGVSIKPIETGDDADIVAPKTDQEAAIMRRYKIEGPAAEMWVAVDKLLDTRNLDILTLLSPEDRESVRKQLFLGVTHSLRLFGQMVVLDSKPDQLDDQMQLVYEMSDLIDRIVEEVNKYAPVKNALEYVDVEADDPELPDDVQDAIEATGFRIDTWERGEDHFAVEVVKIIEHFQPPIQVMGHDCDEMQRTLGLTVRYFNLGTKRIREVIENFQGPTEIGALLKIYDA